MSDAERVAARLTPAVLAELAKYLESVDSQARSEIVLHHGPDGVARGMTAHVRLKKANVDFPPADPLTSRR